MKKLLTLAAGLFFLSNIAFAQQSDNPELPAIKSSDADAFFIPASVCKKYNVTPAQGDAWMKVYNNVEENAKLQRVNDIRWEAATKEEALQWYKDNSAMLSESGEDVTSQLTRPAAVDAWNVYETNKKMKEMMNSIGMKQNQYTYTFVVGKYVAKIFVGVNEATSLKESWTFAKEGLKAILRATGNPKLAELVL
jgi:hypothetical protein